MTTPEISAVIPTHNRAAFLEPSIASLCEQTLAPDRYEICIVNNLSTDNTPQIVEQLIQRYPKHKIFMVEEKSLGSSHARNKALHCCNSPLLAYGDDDAVVEPDWLEKFLNDFNTLGADLGKVGGEIKPVWGAPRPAWLTEGMLPMLSAATALGTQAKFCNHPLFEGNSCYRREAVLAAGGFPTELGRRGSMLMSGENAVDLLMSVAGWKIYYDPAIVMHHVIHADRLTPGWMRRRYFWQGVTDYTSIQFLKKKGITTNQPENIALPANIQDWAFINDATTPPTPDNLIKIWGIGYMMASTGVIPTD